MPQVIVVQTTIDSRAAAERLAEAIIHEGRGACVQIAAPIMSVYKWEGKIQKEEEYLVSVKTTDQALSLLVELIRQLHTYDVPEIIALPVIDGGHDYLSWVADQVNTQ
ncbi:divalent-cation tolerance protein CutA [Bremerella cremea]|uniref:divalent-cation tolerance protein CutA n=1 Tax=Bremerella cremea TaxID=1031537 RepID=UPI0031F0F0B9